MSSATPFFRSFATQTFATPKNLSLILEALVDKEVAKLVEEVNEELVMDVVVEGVVDKLVEVNKELVREAPPKIAQNAFCAIFGGASLTLKHARKQTSFNISKVKILSSMRPKEYARSGDVWTPAAKCTWLGAWKPLPLCQSSLGKESGNGFKRRRRRLLGVLIIK